MAMANDGDKLTRFFAGDADDDGRAFDEILGWDDARLEMVHDYTSGSFRCRNGAGPIRGRRCWMRLRLPRFGMTRRCRGGYGRRSSACLRFMDLRWRAMLSCKGRDSRRL